MKFNKKSRVLQEWRAPGASNSEGPAGKQLHRKPWGSQQTPSWPWTSSLPLWQITPPKACWAAWGAVLMVRDRSDPAPWLSSGDTKPGCWSSSGLPRDKRHGHTGESLTKTEEVMKDWKTAPLRRVRESWGCSELWEGSGRGRDILLRCASTWRECTQRREPDSFRISPVTGPEAMGTHWNSIA